MAILFNRTYSKSEFEDEHERVTALRELKSEIGATLSDALRPALAALIEQLHLIGYNLTLEEDPSWNDFCFREVDESGVAVDGGFVFAVGIVVSVGYGSKMLFEYEAGSSAAAEE